METPNIKNVSDLMDCIREYEPNLVRYIMDFLFIPCSEDKKGKYEYVRVLPKEGTKFIYSYLDNYVVLFILIDIIIIIL